MTVHECRYVRPRFRFFLFSALLLNCIFCFQLVFVVTSKLSMYLCRDKHVSQTHTIIDKYLSAILEIVWATKNNLSIIYHNRNWIFFDRWNIRNGVFFSVQYSLPNIQPTYFIIDIYVAFMNGWHNHHFGTNASP